MRVCVAMAVVKCFRILGLRRLSSKISPDLVEGMENLLFHVGAEIGYEPIIANLPDDYKSERAMGWELDHALASAKRRVINT
jgi:hypothetical protein